MAAPGEPPAPNATTFRSPRPPAGTEKRPAGGRFFHAGQKFRSLFRLCIKKFGHAGNYVYLCAPFIMKCWINHSLFINQKNVEKWIH